MDNEELKQSLHLTFDTHQLTFISHNFHLVLTCTIDVNFNLDYKTTQTCIQVGPFFRTYSMLEY